MCILAVVVPFPRSGLLCGLFLRAEAFGDGFGDRFGDRVIEDNTTSFDCEYINVGVFEGAVTRKSEWLELKNDGTTTSC